MPTSYTILVHNVCISVYEHCIMNKLAYYGPCNNKIFTHRTVRYLPTQNIQIYWPENSQIFRPENCRKIPISNQFSVSLNNIREHILKRTVYTE